MTLWSPDRYKAAIDFAARVHGDQRVPGSGFPYVVHLSKVAMEAMAACVANRNLDADLVIACALLHDSVEDAGVELGELERAFGAKVAAGVAALTKNSALPKSEQMADSLARIRAQPREVWIVKLADRITNLEPPPPKWPRAKCEAYVGEAQEILRSLRGASVALETRLNEKISAYPGYFQDRT